MTAKGKTFLIVQQVRETTVVTADRPLFRKVYCPSCGRETGVFERDGDGRANAHVILCPEHAGGEKNEETGN